MPRDPHPFADVLAEFPGVVRLTEDKIHARPRAHGPLPVVLLLNASFVDGVVLPPEAVDFSVYMVGDLLYVELSVDMQLSSVGRLDIAATSIGSDGRLPPYTVGIRRCKCKGRDGRLWNPHVVGVLDGGFTPELRQTLADRWRDCVDTKREMFCRDAIAQLVGLGIIQPSKRSE